MDGIGAPNNGANASHLHIDIPNRPGFAILPAVILIFESLTTAA
jgi:hypothetical protein